MNVISLFYRQVLQSVQTKSLSQGRARYSGFTLLEVLVALVFFALIGVMLQEVTASSMNNVLKSRNNSYATWIAENKFAELRIQEGLPAAKEYKEEIEYGVNNWQLVTQVSTTQNPDIQRVEVQVSIRHDDIGEWRRVRSMTGFIGKY